MVVAVIAALGILRLRVDTNHISFFSADHPLGQSAAVIDRELGGVYSFQIMLEGPPESLKTPDALQRIDRLQEALRTFPHVRKVTSVADYVKRINKELNDGRPEANVVPADASTIAQELFVFALGGEGRHELERVVASDYSRAQIAIKLQSMSSDLVLEQVEAGGSDGEGGVRRHRDQRAHDRLRPPVQHARSLSGDVAADQLRHGVLHRVRRHLPGLPLVPFRRADDRARTCCRCWRCSA